MNNTLRRTILLSIVTLALSAGCFGQARPYMPPPMQVTHYGSSWTMSAAENGRMVWSDGRTKVVLRLNPISLEIVPGRGGPQTASSGSLWTIRLGDKVLTSLDFEGTPVETYGPVATIELGDKRGLGLRGILSVTRTDLHRLDLRLDLYATEKRSVQVDFPTLRMQPKSGDLSYCIPRRESIIGSTPIDLREPRCPSLPLQFTDVYGPSGGVYLMIADAKASYRSLHLAKDAKGVFLSVEYPEQEIGPGEGFKSSAATIGFHTGDWHTAFEAYKVWAKTWIKPQTGQACDSTSVPESPSHLDMARFVFPDLRMTAAGSPDQAFFNGMVSDSLSTRMRDIMKAYDDCFTSRAPVPLVPTGSKSVYANQFPGNRRILWTLYNAGDSAAKGELLAVRHTPGARYLDVWHDREIEPRIVKDVAYLSIEIGPRDVGCVVKETRK